MKIMVFGTGAMGSIYAGLLADAGNEVWAVDLWQAHVDAINSEGLRVEGSSGDRIVKSIKATTHAADAGSCDLYIIATKASGVGAAAKAIAPHMGANSLVLTIQNGLGAGERIAEHMPVENVLLGVAAGFGASMKGAGHAHHNAMNLIRLGEMGGGMTPRLEKLTEIWSDAGFSAQAFADINQLIWEKYLCNITTAGPCTVFDCTLSELQNNPAWWEIALGCATEAHTLGVAQKINFGFDDHIAYVTEFVERMPHAKPSMLQDHYHKRRSEIDAINGMAVELGDRLGIPTPYNDVVSAIVRQKEESF
ncbi:MAG: 2-dehydropantoate 2-reductase [Cellvibrionaceae bacterium]|jgi:2-dehydropantoate 2-reductase